MTWCEGFIYEEISLQQQQKKNYNYFFDGYRICRNLTLINGLYEIIITLNLKDNFCRNFIVSNIFFFVFKRFVCNKKKTLQKFWNLLGFMMNKLETGDGYTWN